MYAELHLHTNYSFQEGASSIGEIVGQAAGLGYQVLAVTDHDNLCGAVEFAEACHSQYLIPTAVRLKPVLSLSNGPVLSSGRRSRVSTASDLSNGPVLGPSSLPRCPSPPAPLPQGEGRPKAGVRDFGGYSAGDNQHERFHGRTKGRWRKVLEILDTWRIDDEWWRKQPVSRLYYRVVLEDGTMAGLFKDLIGGQWYQLPGRRGDGAKFWRS